MQLPQMTCAVVSFGVSQEFQALSSYPICLPSGKLAACYAAAS